MLTSVPVSVTGMLNVPVLASTVSAPVANWTVAGTARSSRLSSCKRGIVWAAGPRVALSLLSQVRHAVFFDMVRNLMRMIEG